jgi:hypothetical protein
MKRLKVCSLITAALLTASMTMQYNPSTVFAQENNSVDVQMYNQNTSETTNGITTKYKITNTGSGDVDLSQVKVRYYYTIDGEKAENFYCDSASKVEGDKYTGITGNVTGNFVKMDQPKEGADHYVEISFGSEAGKLAAGGVVEIQGRFSKEDWTSFNQKNDYSFNASASDYMKSDKVVVFVDNQQVSGVLPSTDVPTDPTDPTDPTQTGKVTVDMFNGTTEDSTNSLSPKFKVKNSSDKAVKLSELKLKYYYSSDGDEKENFFCDYAAVTTGGYRGLTGNVKGTINPYTAADGINTNTYLEVGFDDAAGMLEPGQEMEVQTRIAKENWTNFDQTNDYSFNKNSSSYTPWDKVTAEVNGDVIWGQGPKKIIDSVVTTDVHSIDKSDVKDIDVNVQYNGNALAKVKYGNKVLEKDKDYIETKDSATDTGKVTLTSTFLGTLPKGKASIAFDFNQGKDPVLDFDVINSHEVDSEIVTKDVTVDKENVKPVNVDIKYNGNTLTGIKYGDKLLELGKDYTIVNGQVVLREGFLSTLPKGNVALTFIFDGGKEQTLIINVIDLSLDVKVGNVTGKPGDKVVVPVTVEGIQKDKPVQAYTFRLQYDTTKFENLEVTPSATCPDATNEFFVTDLGDGVVKVMFFNPSTTDQTLSLGSDGVLFNIGLTIKADAPNGVSKVPVVKKGSFDYITPDASNQYKVNYVDGSITVKGDFKKTEITPTSIDVDKSSVTDKTVDVKWNGNKFNKIMNGDKELVKGTDYTVDEATGKITLTKSYLDTLPKGQTVLTIDVEGDEDPTLTVNVIDLSLDVKVGDVTGKAGDKVVVPVTVEGIQKDKPVQAYTFRLQYDTTKFENLEVTPSATCPDATNQFFVTDLGDGVVKVMFFNPSTTDQTLSLGSDGVLFNIGLTIKADATDGVSKIPVVKKGSFDYITPDASNQYKVNYVDGSVTIKSDPFVKTEITPASIDVDKSDVKDTDISVKWNGNKFNKVMNGDKELVKGTDYTVDEATGKITLTKSYLSTLPEGPTVLIIDVDGNLDPTLTINVKSPVVVVVDAELNQKEVQFDLSKPADVLVGVTYNNNTLGQITNGTTALKSGTDYTIVNGNVSISQTYLKQFKKGDVVNLNFDFAPGNDKTLKINIIDTAISNAPSLMTDAVEVKAGDTFEVPLMLNNVPSTGIALIDLNIKYDTSALECVGCKFGSMVPNAINDALFSIKQDLSYVAVSYCSSNRAAVSLKKSGVLATLTFKVKDTAAKGELSLTEQRKTTAKDTKKVLVPLEVSFGKITVK